MSNEATILGKPFSQSKHVRKILKSLPPRFRMKVIVLHANVGFEKKIVTELPSNLQT